MSKNSNLAALVVALTSLVSTCAQAALEAGQAVKYTYTSNRFTDYFHVDLNWVESNATIDMPGLTFNFIADDYLAPGQTYSVQKQSYFDPSMDVTIGADGGVSSWYYLQCEWECWNSSKSGQYAYDRHEDYHVNFDRYSNSDNPGSWRTEVISFEKTGSSPIQFLSFAQASAVPEADTGILAGVGMLMTLACYRRRAAGSTRPHLRG